MNLPKNDFRVKYLEALDMIMTSRTRFALPSFIAFSNLELCLILSIKGQKKGQGIVDEKVVKYIREIYSEDPDEDKPQIEMDVLRTILADVNITCFADI